MAHGAWRMGAHMHAARTRTPARPPARPHAPTHTHSVPLPQMIKLLRALDGRILAYDTYQNEEAKQLGEAKHTR